MSIHIIFGEPGSGKTAYLTAIALTNLGMSAEAYELQQSSIEQVRCLNAQGYNFNMPDRPPVYTNYPVRACVGYRKYRDSLWVDGYHLGFANEFVAVTAVYPGSKIFLTEAQRYFNSREFGRFPDWASRFYEEHRHFGLEIYLDVQRLGLIDINLREIATEFLEVEKLQHNQMYNGNILRTKFIQRRWTSISAVEQYIKNGTENYDIVEYVYEGNVFDGYESTSYFNAFIPDGEFGYKDHSDMSKLSLKELVYKQTAPYGFYKDEAKKILEARAKAKKE